MVAKVFFALVVCALAPLCGASSGNFIDVINGTEPLRRQGRRRSLRTGEHPIHCGCLDCTQEIWDRQAADLLTGESYTCGERMTYLMDEMGLAEQDACATIAGD